jgi:hypothetical protein
MKSSLAIYGDSYAREASWSHHDSWEKRYRVSWPSILENLYGYNVHVFAEQGSDFMFSYEQFMKTHHDYEKVVFIVTDHQRYHLNINNKLYFLAGLKYIEDAIKYNKITEDSILDIIKSIEKFYTYAYKDELNAAGVAFLSKNINNIRPDAIVEYAFENPFIDSFYLRQISDMENEVFRINLNNFKDCRPAHMTEENNKIFAEYIHKKLSVENLSLQLSDFVAPNILDRNKYFMKK